MFVANPRSRAGYSARLVVLSAEIAAGASRTPASPSSVDDEMRLSAPLAANWHFVIPPRSAKGIPKRGLGNGNFASCAPATGHFPTLSGDGAGRCRDVVRRRQAPQRPGAHAEDLTAEVFLAALRPLRLSASMAEVRAYLRASARTVLAAHWRETLGVKSQRSRTIWPHPTARKPSAPHRNGSTRCSMCCRTTTAGFWNYGSCKAIRSGRRRQRWV
jgi:hypothetical protein